MEADELIKKLDDIYKKFKKTYSSLYILSEVDYSINDIVENYKNLSYDDKFLIRLTVNENSYNLLQAFSGRVASKCLNIIGQNLFTNGLYALGVGIEKFDFREPMMTLSLFYEVSIRTGLSFHDFLESKEPFAETVKKFLARKDLNNIITLMGYEILKNNDGEFYFHYNPSSLKDTKM